MTHCRIRLAETVVQDVMRLETNGFFVSLDGLLVMAPFGVIDPKRVVRRLIRPQLDKLLEVWFSFALTTIYVKEMRQPIYRFGIFRVPICGFPGRLNHGTR